MEWGGVNQREEDDEGLIKEGKEGKVGHNDEGTRSQDGAEGWGRRCFQQRGRLIGGGNGGAIITGDIRWGRNKEAGGGYRRTYFIRCRYGF